MPTSSNHLTANDCDFYCCCCSSFAADGVDPDSCSNVLIERVNISTGDGVCALCFRTAPVASTCLSGRWAASTSRSAAGNLCFTIPTLVHPLSPPHPHCADCIAIKAGWAPWAVWHDGQREGYSVPTINITVRDLTCATQSGEAALHTHALVADCSYLHCCQEPGSHNIIVMCAAPIAFEKAPL